MTHPHQLLDDAFTTPVRLSVMAALTPDAEIAFTVLRDMVETSDSQLSKAISLLESRGYITTIRTRDTHRPRIYISATRRGLTAFSSHVDALRTITLATILDRASADPTKSST